MFILCLTTDPFVFLLQDSHTHIDMMPEASLYPFIGVSVV